MLSSAASHFPFTIVFYTAFIVGAFVNMLYCSSNPVSLINWRYLLYNFTQADRTIYFTPTSCLMFHIRRSDTRKERIDRQPIINVMVKGDGLPHFVVMIQMHYALSRMRKIYIEPKKFYRLQTGLWSEILLNAISNIFSVTTEAPKAGNKYFSPVE